MGKWAIALVIAWCLPTVFLACSSSSEPVSADPVADESPSSEESENTESAARQEQEIDVSWEPVAPALRRLTKDQYQNTLADTFGEDLVIPTAIEPDAKLDGLYAVGASVTGLSLVGTEKYFSAASAVAKQVVNSPTLRNQHVPCAAEKDQASSTCLEETAKTLGKALWRRNLEDAEIEQLTAQAIQAQETMESKLAGLEIMIMAMLMAPDFLYIVTPAEDIGDDTIRYTGTALASRLSYFLWNSCPDKELLEAADSGLLDTEEGLRDQVTRMLADPKIRRGVRALFIDWWELDLLDSLIKEPSSFSHFYARLGEDAREETLSLVEHLVIDAPEDIRNLYTTTTTFVNPPLAALYEVPAPTLEGFGMVQMDPNLERAGILGHVSFLATQAHPTRPSPTLRGVFIREKLLCMSMPPPPANVDTTVPEASADAPTMREILEVHMQEDTCRACHLLTDPIGLGLERFDGIGRYRLLENGVPIDPTGLLDGVPFEDARGIGRALAKHPLAAPCMVSTVWMYANGRGVEDGEAGLLTQLETQFEQSGYRFLQLMEDVALHPAFSETREEAP